MEQQVVDRVAQRATESFDSGVEILSDYLRIPAISCDPNHFADVRALASRIQADLATLGLNNCRLLDLPDALPCVAADWLEAGPDKPTILIYGHLDLQPVTPENWDSPPHEPTIRNGRLYARGSSDDMGGWVSHMVAIQAWLSETGELPCNIRLIIEGEEEIGSPNLERYMDAYPDAFTADVMVLTDCENPSPEVPGLTVSLRGLIEVRVRVEALAADVHSGLWGNMVPDVSTSLIKLIASLLDDDGRLTVGRVTVSEKWQENASKVPLTDEVIAEGAHIIPGVTPLPLRGKTRAEWLWRQPSMTIVSTTLPSFDVKKNALRKSAEAILSIRVPPEVTPKEMYTQIEAHLAGLSPGGVKVTVSEAGWSGEGWLYTPKGPAFAAADRAYMKSWGAPLVQVGVGGSIPFVALFGRRFGDLPLILNGVMDPLSTAHGPNESLHLGIFKKAIVANVHLFEELAKL